MIHLSIYSLVPPPSVHPSALRRRRWPVEVGSLSLRGRPMFLLRFPTSLPVAEADGLRGVARGSQDTFQASHLRPTVATLSHPLTSSYPILRCATSTSPHSLYTQQSTSPVYPILPHLRPEIPPLLAIPCHLSLSSTATNPSGPTIFHRQGCCRCQARL